MYKPTAVPYNLHQNYFKNPQGHIIYSTTINAALVFRQRIVYRLWLFCFFVISDRRKLFPSTEGVDQGPLNRISPKPFTTGQQSAQTGRWSMCSPRVAVQVGAVTPNIYVTCAEELQWPPPLMGAHGCYSKPCYFHATSSVVKLRTHIRCCFNRLRQATSSEAVSWIILTGVPYSFETFSGDFCCYCAVVNSRWRCMQNDFSTPGSSSELSSVRSTFTTQNLIALSWNCAFFIHCVATLDNITR